MYTMLSLNTTTIPHAPGVYLFRKESVILYVGKASDLKNRLSFYFRPHVNEKIRRLREAASSVEIIVLSSEIEALIKEAELIKRHAPAFNISLRDDKNYAYVAITHEPFPHVRIAHQPKEKVKKTKSAKNKSIKRQTYTYIGPYTSSTSLAITLKLSRKLFPYCTCPKPHRRRCLNAEMGLCPGYCCMQIYKNQHDISLVHEYNAHIHALTSVITGKGMFIIRDLKKIMRQAIATQNFEKAALLRDQWQGIEDVLAHRLYLTKTKTRKKNYRALWRNTEKHISMALGIPSPISRVEGYDISHVSGTHATGSMVVFTDGVPNRDHYRMFKIKTIQGISDVDMLKEVIQRRLAHHEWQLPDLMVIDGGKPQLNAVLSIIKTFNLSLSSRVVALAKRLEEIYQPQKKEGIRLNSLPSETGFFFQRIRDESHRFAKKYHHKLREISYRPAHDTAHQKNKIRTPEHKEKTT